MRSQSATAPVPASLTPLEEPRIAEAARALVSDLAAFTPDTEAGRRALQAFEALLALPPARLAAALPQTYDAFERACTDAVPDAEADTVAERLRSHLRAQHAELLRVPAFGQHIEAPRRRASMLEWLLRENVNRLERMNHELTHQAAETDRLRSELSRLAEERETLSRELARNRSLADVGLMTAGVVHDFNNLLQSIIGYASLTHDDLPADDSRRDTLERSLSAAHRAAELTQRLMSWARHEPGEAEPCELSALVAEVLDLLAPSAPPKVLLQRTLAASLPAVMADPSELRRIVLNLVMNAWQALGTQPGEVHVSTGRIEGGREPRVFLEVEDDGRGMDDATRERLFEPFFSTREEGIGLGLPTVRRIVEKWGGTIEVWSESGRGTRFRVALPAMQAGAGANANASHAA